MGLKNKLLGVVAVLVLIVGLLIAIPSGGTSLFASVGIAAILVAVIIKGAVFS